MGRLEVAGTDRSTQINSNLLERIESHKTLDFYQLSQLKHDIENELSSLFDSLSFHKVDMFTPLITSQGFPRDDIDLVSVRLLKRNINILRNDMKEVLSTLDSLITLQFQAKSDRNPSAAETLIKNLNLKDNSIAFARVLDVKLGSPSHNAGLQHEDLIIQFHTIDATNHNNLASIGSLVRNNQDNELQLKIKRKDEIMTLCLTPTSWDGPGLLGCRLIQI